MGLKGKMWESEGKRATGTLATGVEVNDEFHSSLSPSACPPCPPYLPTPYQTLVLDFLGGRDYK
jgi:hypothetical protein